MPLPFSILMGLVHGPRFQNVYHVKKTLGRGLEVAVVAAGLKTKKNTQERSCDKK
jgi:hypothetical protein